MIANDAGFHLDFRAPLIGPRMRKRYVFFSRSRDVLEDVGCYFGTEVYAPSEELQPPRPPVQRSHAAWRPGGWRSASREGRAPTPSRHHPGSGGSPGRCLGRQARRVVGPEAT